MAWTNKNKRGNGQVMTAAVVATGVPVTSDDMYVGILDRLSLFFTLTRVAATSVEWWLEGSYDGVSWFRMPAILDEGTPPGVTHADGEHTRAQAVSGSWAHTNIEVTGLHSVRVVVDTTAGTTDTMDVFGYGEALSS